MSSKTEHHRDVYTCMKTQLPAPSAELIERPRLMGRLPEAQGAKLVILHAPAGYGKSSLLQQWSERLLADGATVAWFTPDRGDREPQAFLGYLLRALEEAGHRVGEQLQARVSAETYLSWKIVATQLANSFAGRSTPCYLFIDDLQHLRESEALQCLRYLIETTPPDVRFVLATREDPGIPLGRLRAMRHVFEVRAQELRFSSSETASYFATRGYRQLTSAQLVALDTRAEGWIVGLKLLSMAMQRGGADTLTGVAVTGEHAEVADFFAEDVLARQSQAVRDFLLRTCVLERMCPALCDSLPGICGSRALIERCVADGLFLVTLDRTRTWYRYHSLFADFLRRQLNDRHPGLASQLYIAASHWLQRSGLHAEAFDYALKADDAIRAAEILDAQCDVMWIAGRQQLIQSMAERLPPHVQALFPRIMLAVSWRLVAQWRVDQAQQLVAVSRARLAEMERAGCEERTVRNLRHRILHRQSQIAHHLYQLDVVEGLSRQLCEENAGDEDDPYLKASVLLTLQYAQREQFQFENLSRYVELAREALERTGFSHGMVFLSAACGPSFVQTGRTQEALRLLTEGLKIARDMTGHGSSFGAVVGLHCANLLYNFNEIESALELMEEYFSNDPQVGTADQLVAGWLTQSRLARLRGDFASSLESLQEASEFAERHSVQRLRLVAAAEYVRVLLRMGCPDDAGQYARRCGLVRATEQPARGCLNTADSAQAQAWCRLAASQGRMPEALPIARRWRARVTSAGAIQSAVEWGVLVAELLNRSGDRKAAQRALWQALILAAPARFVRVFLDEGEPILSLLEQLADGESRSQDVVDDFRRGLLVAGRGNRFSVAAGGDQECPDRVAVAGRLSSRELEILVLAGGGMLNKRISQRLGLTEGTVKWYLQQVFDKLGVRDRGRAAARARQLGLIS